VEQPAQAGAAKAVAFANGLRKSVANSGRRWAQWPGGANDLALVLGIIDGVQQYLQSSFGADEGEAAVAAGVADLRAVLEWSTYQSASLATARALLFARKTRTFAERVGLIAGSVPSLDALADSEESLIENVRVKNDYMIAIAARHSHLGLPAPLVSLGSLAPKVAKPPGRLDLIQQLMKQKKKR